MGIICCASKPPCGCEIRVAAACVSEKSLNFFPSINFDTTTLSRFPAKRCTGSSLYFSGCNYCNPRPKTWGVPYCGAINRWLIKTTFLNAYNQIVCPIIASGQRFERRFGRRLNFVFFSRFLKVFFWSGNRNSETHVWYLSLTYGQDQSNWVGKKQTFSVFHVDWMKSALQTESVIKYSKNWNIKSNVCFFSISRIARSYNKGPLFNWNESLLIFCKIALNCCQEEWIHQFK